MRKDLGTSADIIFVKRIYEIMIDLAEAESRTHNRRFARRGFFRNLRRPLETRIRKSPRLMRIAIRFRNLI
jgi:hypothetical protein